MLRENDVSDFLWMKGVWTVFVVWAFMLTRFQAALMQRVGSKCPPYGEFGNVWATGRQPENRIRAFQAALIFFCFSLRYGCFGRITRGQRVPTLRGIGVVRICFCWCRP